VVVEGHSMEPGLQPGDRLLVLRERRPRLGEIVALVDPREKARLLVKRLIEVSGDGYEVAGDNPEASTDSRAFGPVGRDALRGRAVYRYGPAGRTGPLH
jgi:nickel-type superoxide dismutase maturation protease